MKFKNANCISVGTAELRQLPTQTVNSFCSFVRLFAELPRPGVSEMTFAVFESSCHLLLPV